MRLEVATGALFFEDKADFINWRTARATRLLFELHRIDKVSHIDFDILDDRG